MATYKKNMWLIAVMALACVGVVMADNLVNYPTASGGTGFSVDESGNGTFGGTVTATTITGSSGFAGDITCDDITASGADSASLDINIPASTNAQMGTITVKSQTAVANLTDNDYVRFILLNMYNSATTAVNYCYIDAEADDVTTATEDGSIDFYIEINSTATKVLDLNATGATVAGVVDVDSVTVNAGAGIDNQAAGTLVVGASTATKVEIADTGVETEIQGTLDVLAAADFNGAITCTNVTVDSGSTFAFNGAAVTWTNTGSLTVDGAVAVTTNQTFLSATGVTNTLVIVDGLIKAIQ